MGYYEAKITEAYFVVEPAAERSALDRGRAQRCGRGDEPALSSHSCWLETEDVYRVLGPFVRAGSYVRMHSGTGARWRDEFDGTVTQRHDEPDAPWYGC